MNQYPIFITPVVIFMILFFLLLLLTDFSSTQSVLPKINANLVAVADIINLEA